MIHWWSEEWSLGAGPSRVSCEISRTSEGYAVEVFRGELCAESFLYRSRGEAIAACELLKLQYRYSFMPVKDSRRGRSSPP